MFGVRFVFEELVNGGCRSKTKTTIVAEYRIAASTITAIKGKYDLCMFYIPIDIVSAAETARKTIPTTAAIGKVASLIPSWRRFW